MALLKIYLIKVKETIKKAKLKIENINEIILVGGSTRIPKIKEMEQKYFNKELLQTIKPDDIVTQGMIFTNNRKLKINNKSENLLIIEL